MTTGASVLRANKSPQPRLLLLLSWPEAKPYHNVIIITASIITWKFANAEIKEHSLFITKGLVHLRENTVIANPEKVMIRPRLELGTACARNVRQT
jgi:hypothetical protein